MDRVDYQNLRFSVENQIHDLNDGRLSAADVTNSVMRLFIQAMAASQVKRNTARRALVTFRRDAQLNPPGWAYREPGISDRLPTL